VLWPDRFFPDVGLGTYEKRNSSVRLELHYYTIYILVSVTMRRICDRITGIRAMLRSSSKRSQSRILVSKGYRVRVSHVSVNPSCRVSKWTKSGNKPKERWFTRESVERGFKSATWYLDEKIKPRA
jgi:hypothetical protein